MTTSAILIATMIATQIGPWDIAEGFGDRSTCTMAQTIDPEGLNQSLGITFSPLARSVRINADREGWRLGQESREVTVSFSPSEIDFSAQGVSVGMPGGDALSVEIEDLLILDLLARSKYVMVSDDQGNAARFSLVGSSSALKVLKDCAYARMAR